MVDIWVDVFNAAGDRLGDGPVETIQSAEVNRQLDGTGTFNLRAVVSARSIALFKNENRVKIFAEDAGGKRLIGQGIIEVAEIVESPSGVSLRVIGPDILDELARKNTLTGRIFNQKTLQFVADGLIALVPGWSVVVDAGIAANLVDARYDGASVLKSFRDIVGRYGYHFRLSSDDKVISISQFGVDSGERVFKTQVITQAMIRDPSLLFVQRLPQTTESSHLANWILPLGAGEGTGQLTLEKSTRAFPYTIQSMVGPEGLLIYFLADADSVAAYGQIETVKLFKQIAALTNSDGDIINAANALYDAAAEWLGRNKDPITRYAVTVKNAKNNLLPGDKLHINYKGQIITEKGEVVDYMTIRDDFWIMRAIERIGLEQHSVDLEISNVDQRPNSVEEQVADSMEEIRLRDLKPEISSTTRSFVYDREISADAPGFTAIVPIKFTDATLSMQRVLFNMQTTPFRATAKSAASQTSGSGTTHQHRMFTPFGGGTGAYTRRGYSDIDGNNIDLNARVAGNINTGFDISTHTHEIAEAALTYGISDDTELPKNVTVWVNGVDKTTELFGFTPLAPTGVALDVQADAGTLSNLINNAAGGLRQEHTIEIKCADQQGRVEATIEIFEVNQSVLIS